MKDLVKLPKETIEKENSWMPKSKWGHFTFVCPICGEEHVKPVEFIMHYHKDSFSMSSYRLTYMQPVCYQCQTDGYDKQNPETLKKLKDWADKNRGF